MSDQTTIPVLPAGSLDETPDFYQTLGFEITDRPQSPNPHAVVGRARTSWEAAEKRERTGAKTLGSRDQMKKMTTR